MVFVLPAGGPLSWIPGEICAAIGAPSGTPLPRLVSHELQRPGRVCSYVYEGHRPDGSAFCVSALYLYDAADRGVLTHSALERLLHGPFAIFKSHSTSDCSDGGGAVCPRGVRGWGNRRAGTCDSRRGVRAGDTRE